MGRPESQTQKTGGRQGCKVAEAPSGPWPWGQSGSDTAAGTRPCRPQALSGGPSEDRLGNPAPSAGTLSLHYTLSPAPWRSLETTPSTNWPQRNTALKRREAVGKRHTWAFPVLRVEPRRPQASGHCTVNNSNGHSPHLGQSLTSQRYFYTGVSNKKLQKVKY